MSRARLRTLCISGYKIFIRHNYSISYPNGIVPRASDYAPVATDYVITASTMFCLTQFQMCTKHGGERLACFSLSVTWCTSGCAAARRTHAAATREDLFGHDTYEQGCSALFDPLSCIAEPQLLAHKPASKQHSAVRTLWLAVCRARYFEAAVRPVPLQHVSRLLQLC